MKFDIFVDKCPRGKYNLFVTRFNIFVINNVKSETNYVRGLYFESIF